MEPNIHWVQELRRLIISSIKERGLPIPASRDICDGWRRDVDTATTRRVLYTSCMYQMAPAIKKAVELLEKSGAARGGLAAKLAALGGRVAGSILATPSREELERSYRILKSIYTMLKRSGVEFGVLDQEPYSGALLYELGFEEDFAAHAAEVYRFFKTRGVEEVITVDPHTHYVLEKIYPRYVENFDIKVVNYLDLARPTSVKIKNFVIHDSCLYSRFLDRYDRVRQLLAAGDPVEDPYVTGRDTSGCCGGPAESIAPGLARKIASIRVSKLSKLSDTAVVACPICLVNMSAVGTLRVLDIAEVLEP